MPTSYGVVWREGALPAATGKLELLSRGLRLEGLAGAHPIARVIDYEGLTGVRVGRAAEDRIDGRQTVVLERRSGLPLTIATVGQPSFVGEIAERLTALQLGAEAASRTAFVLPLKAGAHAAVRALLDAWASREVHERPAAVSVAASTAGVKRGGVAPPVRLWPTLLEPGRVIDYEGLTGLRVGRTTRTRFMPGRARRLPRIGRCCRPVGATAAKRWISEGRA